MRLKKPTFEEIKEAAMGIRLLLRGGVDTDQQLHSAENFLLRLRVGDADVTMSVATIEFRCAGCELAIDAILCF